jgi:hypothetical protein
MSAVRHGGGKVFFVLPARAFSDKEFFVYETIQEMRRLATLSGSVGRLITRFIVRHFNAVLGGYEIEFRACAKRVQTLLEFAVFVAYMQSEAKDEDGRFENPGVRISVLPLASSHEVSMVVRVDELPDTVKERQVVLRCVADAMERLLRCHAWIDEYGMLEHEVRSYLGDLYYRREDESFRIFGDLVKGAYGEIEKCDRRLVCLAAKLNTDIAKIVPAGFDLALEGLGVDEVEELRDSHSGCALESA